MSHSVDIESGEAGSSKGVPELTREPSDTYHGLDAVPAEEKRFGIRHKATASASGTGAADDDDDGEILSSTASTADKYSVRNGVYTTAFGRFFAPLRRLEATLDRKLGVEAQGPQRVLPEERTKPRPFLMFCLWTSATLNLSCFASGLIASSLGLDLRTTLPLTVAATLTGSLFSGWCATQGPKMGLRQISIGRYSFGWWPSKLLALLNFVEQLGWSAVACITGGLALTAASDGKVSLVLGVIIVALVASTVSFFGLRALLRYEQFAWIPVFVIFLVMFAEAGPKADLSSTTSLTGTTYTGACLTWFSIVYGSTSSWAIVVSDYYVQYPVSTPGWITFTYTVLGMFVPTCFGMVLGNLVGSTVLVDPVWNAANEQGLGYLIQTIIHPYGFAKFCLVLLVLSGIGNTCLCVYSSALSIQQFARPLMAIPRTIWTLLVLACVLLLGLIGREHLQEYLENFLALLGYWNTSFVVVLFTEHYLFRKGDYANYDLTVWNDRRYMPVGWAGGLAFFVGVAGWVLGMSETLYTGPIAAKIGSMGGDVGNELSFAFTLITYVPARWLEYKIVGR